MNLEYKKIIQPLRVMMVNPLSPGSQMFAIKIFNGLVFGFDQYVNMTLLVYDNEVNEALRWKRQIETTSPPCFNSIDITTNLPCVSDADVFVIYTNFKNPNIFELEDTKTAECFDSIYLLLKVATRLVLSEETEEEFERGKIEKRNYIKKHGNKPFKRKPIFICDGLIPMDILNTFSTNIPSDSFFCPTPVPAIATSILGDHLRVMCTDINRIHVFGANDKMFHIEFERPLFVKDKRPEHKVANVDDLISKHCDWDLVRPERWNELNLDYTSFNASWIKKEFIEKVKITSSNNLHGPLFKSARMTKSLRAIWLTRSKPERIPNFRAVGAISDGSMGTIKGLPYVFPLNFYGENWKVNAYFANNYSVKAEIQKYNKIVQEQHRLLIPYCRKFFTENLILKKFAHQDSTGSSSAYTADSMGMSSSSLRES